MRPELPVAAVSKDVVALIAVVAVLLLTAAVAAVFATSVASASASTSAAPAELAAGLLLELLPLMLMLHDITSTAIIESIL